MPSMREWVDTRIEQWKERMDQRQIQDVAERLLSDRWQAEILEAVRAERTTVLARIKAIDDALEALAARKAEQKEIIRAAAWEAQVEAPSTVTRLDGSIREKPGRTVLVKTAEAMPAQKELNRIREYMEALKMERSHRQVELGDLARIERQTKAGLVTGLLHLSRSLEKRIPLLGGMLPRARYCDRLGNILPPECLNADGEPDLPSKPAL